MGRPAHTPDPTSRRQVEALAGYGVPERISVFFVAAALAVAILSAVLERRLRAVTSPAWMT